MIALRHALIPTEYAKTLMYYGMGTAKEFSIFHGANFYITQSHFVRGYHGKKFDTQKWIDFVGKPSSTVLLESLNNMKKCISLLAKGRQIDMDVQRPVINGEVLSETRVL